MNSGRRFSLDRLKGRSLAELRFRARQFSGVLLERAGWLDQREFSPDELFARLRPESRAAAASCEGWIRQLRTRGGRGFFAGFDDLEHTASLAKTCDADGVQRVLARADDALAGRLTLLGYGPLDVGLPIDWHLDPVADIRAPRDHWSRVPYLDPAVAGDHKRVWEVNRHQWLVSLGQAWVLTREARYAAAIDAALTSWMDANPPTRGINWASSLEVGFRAMAWVWTLRLAAEAPALSDTTVRRAVGHLVLSARHLKRNLSTYFSPNTHLTGEALALYHIGVELGDLAEAARWRHLGREVLTRWLPRHVRPDGTYFEQSTWYHRYTLDFYAHFLALASRNGETLPAVRDAVRRLGVVLAAITRPDGSFPLIGDDDGGRLLFLDGRPGTNALPALALAGALTNDADLIAAGAAAQGDVAWILGQVPVVPNRTTRPNSQFFSDGGLAVLRATDAPEQAFMVVDAGPHGSLNCGHAHADALSFELTIGGTALLADPGTGSYSADPAARDRYRATGSHNAATFNGRSSSVMAGPFAWARQATTRVEWWAQGPWGAWLRGTHDGFEPESSYQRDLIALGDSQAGCFVVVDSWNTTTDGLAEVHLQAGLGIQLSPTGVSAFAARKDGVVCGEMTVVGADPVLGVGEISPAYGLQVEAPRLRAGVRGRGALRVATVMAAPGVARGARWIDGDTGRCLEVTLPGATQLIGFGPFRSTHMQLDMDATAWWLQRDLSGGITASWMAAGGNHLRVGVTTVTPTFGAR